MPVICYFENPGDRLHRLWECFWESTCLKHNTISIDILKKEFSPFGKIILSTGKDDLYWECVNALEFNTEEDYTIFKLKYI